MTIRTILGWTFTIFFLVGSLAGAVWMLLLLLRPPAMPAPPQQAAPVRAVVDLPVAAPEPAASMPVDGAEAGDG